MPAAHAACPQTTAADLAAAAWQLVWGDEFAGLSGSPPDPSKWDHALGGEGWGNRELQYYTNLTDNAALDGNSCLVITARAATDADRDRSCWYGPCRYTSARLLTRTKFTFTHGLVEARIQLPFGQGIWPALWMLGDDYGKIGWPACGEIDIMENIGREAGIVHGTVHGPGYCGGNGIGGQYVLPEGRTLAEDFHLFALDWQPGRLRWYIDNHPYFELLPEQLPEGTAWVFDHPFFLLLNLAVGGEWPGAPDTTTLFPQTMRLDFVRVYQRIF